tara:strand:+ start:358 stop:576 length:219 start_codon:yes stop_codon:yes gene_type:complete
MALLLILITAGFICTGYCFLVAAKRAEFLKKVQVKMMADMISLYDANQELKKDFDSFSEAVGKDLEIINDNR